MFSNLRFDILTALRGMRRQPAFVLVVVATLAIGIGANTAMFALVYAALLEPLPYKDPGRLVIARRTLPEAVTMWHSAPDYYDYKDQIAGFQTLAASSGVGAKVTVTGGARPERVPAAIISTDLLTTLGVAPVAGRQFSAEEGKAGAPPVVLISERLAARRFGDPRRGVGQALGVAGIAAEGVSATVVGILPSSFRLLEEADIWVPMRRGEDDGPETRMFHNWVLVGRLRQGRSMAQVQEQATVVAKRLQQQYPATNKDNGLRLDPLQDVLMRRQKPRLILLMAAVAVVLLIACANVAGLLLARGVARRPELAVRAALGATRRRIAAQLLSESLLLGGMAGVAGVALALWLQDLLPVATGLAERGVVPDSLDARVLAFALGASLITGVLCGVAPAIRASSLRLAEHLAPGTRATDSRGGSRLRGILVVVQVALSLVLLVGSGLLLRSLAGLMSADLRFDASNLVTTTINVPYEDETRRLQFQAGLYEDLAAIPGVSALAFTSHVPILEAWGDPPMYAASRPPADASQERTAFMRVVTPGFFKALGIRARTGRDLQASDRIGTPRVLVINDSMARQFFPGENPIGQRVVMPGGRAGKTEYEVVGVVDNPRTESVGDDEPYPAVYGSANQMPLRAIKLLVRSSLPLETLHAAVRKAVASRNPDIAVDPLVRMEDILGESLAPERVVTITLTAFSAVALFLAVLGLYGVLTHFVAQRTHELGIRLALGADARSVIGLVLWRSASLVGPGVAAGLAAAFAATRLLSRFLYGVPPTDPATFAGVGAVLAVVALSASAWPAWRAARIDPVRALRGE